MGRIVAIDYGQKRVGIAVTDALKMIASPLATVSSREIIAFLKDYTGKNEVECLVVGEPKRWDNSPSESSKFIEPFVKKLAKEFPGIPVERMDERFTSVLASRAILESGAKKKVRQDKSLVDKVSAAIILQSYLEQHHH